MFWLQVFSQSDSIKTSPSSRVEDIFCDMKHTLNVGLGLLRSPFTGSSTAWMRVGCAGLTTSAFFLIDPAMQDFARSNQSPFKDRIFSIEDYLNGKYGTFYAAGIYFIGWSIREETVRRTGLYALEAVVYAETITRFLKFSFGRKRPEGADHLFFKPFRGTSEYFRSLPSGHTTGAFAFSTVMAKSIDNIYWQIFWYCSASLVGMARIYHNNHWFSDTFLASIIGYRIAGYVVSFSSRRQTQDKKYRFGFSPREVSITWQF